MKNNLIKKLLPIASALIIFVVISLIYSAPTLKGKAVKQGDMVAFQGMSKEIVDFREKYDEEPLWTNSMFGGMPAYLISIHSKSGNLMPYVRSVLTLGLSGPPFFFISYMLGFFILLVVLGVNPWLSIIGAIAFAFTSYTPILIEAGHITKAMAISYMAPTLASVILICRKKYLLGTALLSLFMALELLSGHVQVTYYLLMMLAIYVVFEYVNYLRQKDYTAIYKTLFSFIVAAVISFGCNSASLLNTMDYVKYTIRGESELSDNKSNKTSGLDRDYVVAWSMGKAETMSLMIPGFKGRSSAMLIGENKDALKNVEPSMKEYIGGGIPQYWGDQPFTSARYAGAVVAFLFVLGLFIVEGRFKWVLLSVTVLSMCLSWGKNFMGLTNLFLDYLPGYDKFRSVSMILILAEFTLPLLAILAVDKLLRTPDILSHKIKLAFSSKEISVLNAFVISFALTGGLSLLYYVMPDLVSFTGASDENIYQQVSQSNGPEMAQQFINNVIVAREALFKSDALRSFVFILLAAVTIWLFLKSKIKQVVFVLIIGVLILVDLWTVDKKFLNDKNFVAKQETQMPFPETFADQEILKDTDPNYRVFNIAVNTFNDASTSYRHKSIGGYHPAKLRRYQDLIERHIVAEQQQIIKGMQSQTSLFGAQMLFANTPVLNMLNTRYIIYNPQAPPLKNTYALGNAWFVTKVKMVKDADEEIAELGKIDPTGTALVDQRFKNELNGFNPKSDSSATIKLTDYKANQLTYESTASAKQLAVFSEIYYEDGWNAYVDGKLQPHFRVDYVLRGMLVPAGKHKIEFKFEPQKYYTREKIVLASSIVLFAFLGFSIFQSVRKK